MDRSATVNHDHLQQYMVNFNPIHSDYIVRWQSDIENTKERPLHKPSQDQSKSTALGGVWNFAERCMRGVRAGTYGRVPLFSTWWRCRSWSTRARTPPRSYTGTRSRRPSRTRMRQTRICHTNRKSWDKGTRFNVLFQSSWGSIKLTCPYL